MTKWFEEVANDASNIVSSRVRLSRNWEEYKFPSRLEPDEARTMIARLKQNFRDLGDRDGQFYEYEDLELMEKLDRTAGTAAFKPHAGGEDDAGWDPLFGG